MHIRPITPAEVAAFIACCTRTEDQHPINQYLDQMLAQGAMRLDWLFVAEDAGRLLGRVAYWTLPKIGVPLAIVLLDLPWDGAYHSIGAQLITQSVQAMRASGATDIEHVLDSPPQWPQWQHNPDQRHDLLGSLGFAVARETYRFAWPATNAPPILPERLRFRSFDEVGEAAFLHAIKRVSAGSLDQRIKEQRATLGAAEEARATFSDLQGLGYEPAWWRLAYTPTGEFVGLVMPATNPGGGTIGYIGVAPEQRGRGYIDDLLATGTTTLCAAGITSIRTDTDVANAPMAHAFRRAGYTQFATRREYNLRMGCET